MFGAMWRFAKAVLLGALAAAIAPMILTTALAASDLGEVMRGDLDAWIAAYIAILPFIVAFPVVLLSGLFIGLPTTALLKWLGWECLEAYVAVGVIAGAIIPLVPLISTHANDGYWIALLGAVGGGVTAHVWWSSSPAGKRAAKVY